LLHIIENFFKLLIGNVEKNIANRKMFEKIEK